MNMAFELKATRLADIALQEASLNIWDTKYRLKTKSGEPVDRDIDGTYQRVAKALAAVEGKRKAAAEAVASQQALLDRVKGELAALVAAEQRRKAEEEARRVRAALAARNATPRGGTLNTDIGKAPVNPPPPPNAGAAAAVEEAKRQLGKPYEWGGSGPDTFDCSGLTSWAYKQAGITMVKTLADFDWSFNAKIPKAKIVELASAPASSTPTPACCSSGHPASGNRMWPRRSRSALSGPAAARSSAARSTWRPISPRPTRPSSQLSNPPPERRHPLLSVTPAATHTQAQTGESRRARVGNFGERRHRHAPGGPAHGRPAPPRRVP